MNKTGRRGIAGIDCQLVFCPHGPQCCRAEVEKRGATVKKIS